MNSADWEAALALFERALALPQAERDRFIDAACGPDREHAERVKKMVRVDARSSVLLDATPDDLAAALGPEARLEGRKIGPYTIRKVIARGGMGIVCLADRDDVGKQVALKLVAGGLGSPERVSRFMLERRVLASLEHPDIAPLLDAGIAEDGTPWLAMEYVAGQPIDAYCQDNGLALDARLLLFERVARAVGYAHRHLIVHRDIKPSNILVTEAGGPRLVDFGIAKPIGSTGGDESTLTAAGESLMTPQYASPEQVTGATITTASDIYQLGLLLFELVTGVRPPSAREDAVPRPSQVSGLPVPLRRRIEGDLDTIVLAATRREPRERYATAEQLADDVRRHLDGRPVLGRPATAGYQIRKFIGRHRAATATAVAAVLALIGFLLAMGVERRRTEAERVRAERVSDLLVEIFAGADPTVAQGATNGTSGGSGRSRSGWPAPWSRRKSPRVSTTSSRTTSTSINSSRARRSRGGKKRSGPVGPAPPPH